MLWLFSNGCQVKCCVCCCCFCAAGCVCVPCGAVFGVVFLLVRKVLSKPWLWESEVEYPRFLYHLQDTMTKYCLHVVCSVLLLLLLLPTTTSCFFSLQPATKLLQIWKELCSTSNKYERIKRCTTCVSPQMDWKSHV